MKSSGFGKAMWLAIISRSLTKNMIYDHSRSWSPKSQKYDLKSIMVVIWLEMIGDHDDLDLALQITFWSLSWAELRSHFGSQKWTWSNCRSLFRRNLSEKRSDHCITGGENYIFWANYYINDHIFNLQMGQWKGSWSDRDHIIQSSEARNVNGT